MNYKANARTQTWIASLGCVLSASLLACDEPKPKCTVARGDFAATYTLISGEGECAQLTGEVLGVQAYNAQKSKTDKTPDFNRVSIGIQPSSITGVLHSGVVMPNPDETPYGLGDFDSAEPASDGFCTAPKLSVARLSHPDIPEQSAMCMMTPAMPAVNIAYAFSDVRVYTTASALGTQLSAKLTYTKDGCTAKYAVRAVYPVVPCGAAMPAGPASDAGTPPMMTSADDEDAGAADGDEDGGCPPAMSPPPPSGPMVADSSLCSAESDPEHGRPLGSGLSPDYAIRCDPDLLLCVLKNDPPSLR